MNEATYDSFIENGPESVFCTAIAMGILKVNPVYAQNNWGFMNYNEEFEVVINDEERTMQIVNGAVQIPSYLFHEIASELAKRVHA